VQAGPDPASAAAADTRALAEVLYALLTGYWPGDSVTALPAAPRRRGRLYPPGMARAGVPAVLNAIVCRALLPGPEGGAPISTQAQLTHALAHARSRGERSGARHIGSRHSRPRRGLRHSLRRTCYERPAVGSVPVTLPPPENPASWGV
jgi:hypothetical protein